jgi:arginase
MTRFLVVPQWQGSPAARGMLLRDGAEAISGDLPRSATTVLEVPLEAGDTQGTGIARLSAVRRIALQIDDALDAERDKVVIVGGDCSVSIPAVAHVGGDDLAVVWVDAHPDLNTAASSASGAAAGMALRALLGDVPDALPSPVVAPSRVVLVGARDLDPAEADYVADRGIRMLDDADLADPEALLRAVEATGASRVYVHIDVDAVDPAELTGTLWGVPFGLPVAPLAAAIARLKDALPIAGATIAGFAPATPAAAVDDMGAILRLIGAVA